MIEVEFLRNHNDWRKGDIAPMTMAQALPLIRDRIARRVRKWPVDRMVKHAPVSK